MRILEKTQLAVALVREAMQKVTFRRYGRNELLRRLAHPFWFQSFGALMGMDWHSSGIAEEWRLNPSTM